MKHHFGKLLSLGLFFSMIAATTAFAFSTRHQETANTITPPTGYEKPDLSEIPVTETLDIITMASSSIATRSERTFLDYFPDPNFAEAVAETLDANKEDPVSILQLQSITSLHHWEKEISNIEGIGTLTNLTSLSLWGNQLTEIPAEIGNLTNLTYLHLGVNQIEDIPAEIGMLTNLSKLYLGGNQITEIPAAIGNLTNLTTLALGSNQISLIPSELCTLQGLAALTIGGNRITDIPAEISNLTNLTTLGLEWNELKELPSEIVGLTRLNNLYLHANQLSSPLPEHFFSIRNLTLDNQDGTMPNISIANNNDISAEMFLSPLILQLKELTEENLQGEWEIKMPNQEIVQIPAGDGSEITPLHFPQTGNYQVSFKWKQENELNGLKFNNVCTTTMVTYEQSQTHNVTVITRYLDNVLPENTETYQVGHGSAFLQSFDVLEGYDLYNSLLRREPVFDVDMDTKTVSLDLVERDYIIELEFDKTEYRVKLTTKYLDDHLPEQSQTYWTRYGDTFSQTYEIAEGYTVSNLAELPDEVIVDLSTKTVTINQVTQDYDIILEFEKMQFNVTITIIYEDGAYENLVSTYLVPYGNTFETDFFIEQGYAIKKVNFNAVGVSVNRSRQTVTINRVTSPVEITIRVR